MRSAWSLVPLVRVMEGDGALGSIDVTVLFSLRVTKGVPRAKSSKRRWKSARCENEKAYEPEMQA